MNIYNRLLILVCFLPSLFAFQSSNQIVKSNSCNISFELASNWEIEDVNADLYDKEEVEDEFMLKLANKKINKFLNGYDVYDCHIRKSAENRQLGIFIYKDNTLNPFEINYYDIHLQKTGNGQKFLINGVEWTSISKEEKPENFEDYSIYQMTARIKKINILIFAIYPLSMDEKDEDAELKKLLGTFNLFNGVD